MTRHNRTRSPARLLRSLYIWHRWIGLAAALFVLVLSLTGLLLNHTDELELDRRHVTAPALLHWYGIHEPARITAFRTGTVLVADLDGQLYYDLLPLPSTGGALRGGLAYRDMVVVALERQLLLLTPQGELIEALEAPGTPVEALGTDAEQQLLLRTAQGLFRADRDLLDWETAQAGGDEHWAMADTPDDGERAALADAWRGNGLPLERVLLDLHSGRILGGAGVYLMDAAAVVFVLLAASGIWLWTRRRSSARAHARRISAGSDQQDA